ncbi:MAG: tyrosine protein kinase, partial [Parabacteroides merdae]
MRLVLSENPTPVYNINASIIIKDDKKGGNASDLSAFEDIGIISSSKNIDNEIEILRSKSLIKDVVSELGLYINYSGESGFNKTDLYGSSPVLVHFLPEDAERLTAPIFLSISYNSDHQIDVTATVNGNTVNKHFTELPAVLSGEAGTLTFMSNPSVALTGSGNIEVSIVNPLSVAKGYRTALSIEPTSKTTSVVTVSVKNTSKKRGEDFINKLIEIYNKNANNDKNEVAQNTARFIDERISVINQELGTTEQELESFKREAGLTDLSSDAQLAISEQSAYEKLCVENGTQLNLIQYLSEYIRKPENVTATLPANVGLNDETLSGLIAQYNALILERNRLLRTSSETNPVVRRLDSNIED